MKRMWQVWKGKGLKFKANDFDQAYRLAMGMMDVNMGDMLRVNDDKKEIEVVEAERNGN